MKLLENFVLFIIGEDGLESYWVKHVHPRTLSVDNPLCKRGVVPHLTHGHPERGSFGGVLLEEEWYWVEEIFPIRKDREWSRDFCLGTNRFL